MDINKIVILLEERKIIDNIPNYSIISISTARHCLSSSLCVVGRQSPPVTRQEPPAAAPPAAAPPEPPVSDAPQDESMGITAFALFDYQAGD